MRGRLGAEIYLQRREHVHAYAYMQLYMLYIAAYIAAHVVTKCAAVPACLHIRIASHVPGDQGRLTAN